MLNLFHGLDRESWDPFFVVEQDDRVFDRGIFDDARVHVLSHLPDEPTWPVLRRLMGVLRREKPDLIQCFNPRGHRYFYRASRMMRTPPLFCSVRNTNLEPQYLWSEFLNERRRRMMIVNSEGIRRHLVCDGWLDSRRIRLVPNGLDVAAFAPSVQAGEQAAAFRREFAIDPDEKIVLSVGRVAPQKNLFCTLDALARLKDVAPELRFRFVHVGKKAKTGHGVEILNHASKLGIKDRCLFPGAVHDVTPYYQMADVMVLASSWEGLPNVVIENMACAGLSVVSEAADNDDIVRDGRTGFKFATGDPDALCGVLREVLALRPADAEAVRERARKDVVERFSNERMIRTFESIWLESLATGR
jgi:glycosyltransferase involved in cell wall biosynthesis